MIKIQAPLDDLDARFRHQLVENHLSNLGLKDRTELGCIVKGRCPLAMLGKLRLGLLDPGLFILVMKINAMIKLA